MAAKLPLLVSVPAIKALATRALAIRVQEVKAIRLMIQVLYDYSKSMQLDRMECMVLVCRQDDAEWCDYAE